MNYYDSKIEIYFSNVREDLISLLPNDPSQSILEIGSGGGDTLIAIKNRCLASEVVGVELFSLPGTNQNNPALDKFYICNVEESFPELENNYFDIILCGDVLEHLYDPWKIIDKLSGLLKKGGKIIISCPNIQEISTWKKILLYGDFAYSESGILDKTHIRFFCKKNLMQLVSTKSLKLIQTIPNYTLTPRRKKMRFLHFGTLDPFLAPQYIVIGEKI